MKKILIIGGGPAGLSCGYELIGKSGIQFDLMEKSFQVGGISKTVEFNGNYYDLGGHRFFTKIKDVQKMWDSVLKEDFLKRNRLSRIYYNNKFYNYPLQISNVLKNLGLIESFFMGISFIKSKLFFNKKIKSFEDYIIKNFGKRLYFAFFKTYTEKVWGIPCSKIRAEWAAQRIKNLSFISVLINALPWNKKSTKVKSLISSFKYPKFGPGMMYSKMADIINKSNNGKILMNAEVVFMNYVKDKWEVEFKINGRTKKKLYDEVVSTMPLTDMIQQISLSDNNIKRIAKGFSYRGFLVCCLLFEGENKLKDTWIYVHEKSVKLGRLQIENNWSPFMVKDENTSSYGAEYFCSEGDEIWSMNDSDLIKLSEHDIKKCNLLISSRKLIFGNVIRVPKAYPVYDDYYNENISKLKDFVKSLPKLQVAGRYGMFRYNNMDHSVYTGILVARNILGENYDIWNVNQDDEYHEEDKE